MKKELKLDTDKKFILITERGLMSFQMDYEETMAVLLTEFLELWNDQCDNIDVGEAGEKILNLLAGMNRQEDEEDLDKIIRELFGEDNDDDN